MSIRTAELKAMVTNELGASFEDLLEATRVETHRWEGSKRAFKQGADAVIGLLSHIKKDADEELVEPAVAEYAQKYLMRASEALKNLRVQAEAMELKVKGKVEGLQLVVDLTKKVHDQSVSHADVLKEREKALESGDEELLQTFRGRGRPVGAHPGESIRHQRDREAAAETTVDNVNGGAKKVVRKCGNCRKPGHTSPNCPEEKGKKKGKKQSSKG